MKFYIRSEATWKEVQIEVTPQLIKALDTTNDSFSCVLKANTSPTPIKPTTLFKVEYDDQKEQVFAIQNDSVSVFSLNPKTYKHSLTVVQYRYLMSKQLIRNTVLNQPKITRQKVYMAASANTAYADNLILWYKLVAGSETLWYDDVHINRSKVKNVSFKWKIYAIVNSGNGAFRNLKEINTLAELETHNARFNSTINVHIYDTNTNITIYTIYLVNYILDKTYYDVEIKNAINEYLAQHQTANISFMYFKGDTNQGTAREMTFVDQIEQAYITQDEIARTVTIQCELQLELCNYTMYDILETLLKQNKLKSNYGAKRVQPFYLKSSGELYELLTTTYPPDTMTFTQATWFDVLTEIFKFYDAGFRFECVEIPNQEPIFYLEIEYYNDRKNEITKDFSGITINHSDRDYNNGKVVFYQNAVQKIEINKLNTRSTALGVPQKSEFEIVLPKPIYDIEYLSMKIIGTFAQIDTDPQVNMTAVQIDLDLTPFVVNSEIWTTLDRQDARLSQNATIKFERNSKSINVSSYYKAEFNIDNSVLANTILIAFRRFFGGSVFANFSADAVATNWSTQLFDIKYFATNDGRAEMETVVNKYRGNEIVNQNDGLIDLNKLGLNILGESLKNGEPTLTATYVVTDWDNVPKEGDYITYNNEIWVVNIINCKVIKDRYYQCTLEFSKNFNALAMRVHTDKEKRLTNISRSLAVMSEDNYIDYIYASDEESIVEAESIPVGVEILKDCLDKTFGSFDGTDYSASITKTIAVSDWRAYGGAQTVVAEVDPTSPQEIVDENIRGGRYRTLDRGLAGATLQSYSIANTVPGYNNTVNFDNNYNAGQPLGIVGSFDGTIYYDKRDETTKKATITFEQQGAAQAFWVYTEYISLPQYINKNVHDIQIEGFNGETRTSWDENTGYLYIYLRTYTQPTSATEIVITFKYKGGLSKAVEIATIYYEGKNLYLPLIKYGFGNSICFEMQMDDPISAGNELLVDQTGWWDGRKYFSQAVPYTDNDGWSDNITINFFDLTEEGKTSGVGGYPHVLEQITIKIFDEEFTIHLMRKIGSIENLEYYKKPNEIFGLNYEWCFLAQNYNNFFIGSKFINENAITNKEKMPTKRFFLVYANDNFKYSILDVKGHLGTRVDALIESNINASNILELKVVIAGNDIVAKNWAIVDEQNDIYFASNNEATFTNDASTTKVITFTTRRDRL